MEYYSSETPPNSRIIIIAYDPSEDELYACAQACKVDREMVDIVSPAHPETAAPHGTSPRIGVIHGNDGLRIRPEAGS